MTSTPEPSTCAACPRFTTGHRCRASSLHERRHTSEVLWVFTQPEQLDTQVAEPGVSGSLGSVMQTALLSLYRHQTDWMRYHIRRTYAAQCTGVTDDDKPKAAVLETCAPLLRDVLLETQPKLIVAFGATALKQLGIKAKHSDVRGRILEPDKTGLEAPVLVTFSERALMAAPGLFETFKQDLRNGYMRLDRGTGTDTTLEELTKDYVLPSTMDEALALLDEILAGDPTATLSVDTETTSLRPEKDDAKIIAFCFSWAIGKATTILFDHPHAPPEYLERLEELEEKIRELLASRRPKVLHNAKFDLKWIELKYKMPVANVVWCTLCGEHLLDEDKKGNYGLKALTAVWLPKFCGYEDKLYDILTETDTDAIAEVDAKIATFGKEHQVHVAALEGFKGALLAYREKKAAWDLERDAYQAALDEYDAKREALRAATKAWEERPKPPRMTKEMKPKPPKGADATDAAFHAYQEALQSYDAACAAWEAFRAVPKPTKDFVRPEKPPALERPPAEPKDPRSKKERDYSTDAGFERVPTRELQLYGGVDADVTRRLCSEQLLRLRQEGAAAGLKGSAPCRALMLSHAIPASRVLGRMEYFGTRIDQAYIPKLEEGLTTVINNSRDLLEKMAPGVNVNSGPALAKLLYDDGWTHPDGTHMPPVTCLEVTKTGARSTAEKALKPYLKYDEHVSNGKKVKTPQRGGEFLDTLYLYKKALKARDTFLMNLRVLSKRDGKIHTSFHINGTGTGRLSSSDMNLQNVPKALGGFNIKKLFIPDSGMVIVNADYKGAEVRVFTAYAKDPALIKALNDGLDMHSFFASKVFGRPYEDYENRDNEASGLSDEYRKLVNAERTRIKRVVFGILYGAGPGKIAETIGVSLEDGKALIELLFTMFPAIRDYIDEVKYLVARDGYVETLFGRRRRFPLTATSRHRSRAERQACNFKIQSTSSDIVISQLIEIDAAIRSDQTWPEWGIHKPLHTYGVRLLLTVHDSIVLQWPKQLLPALVPWLTYYGEQRVRERYTWLPVPFKMDIECGDSYGECMPVEKYVKGLPPNYFDEGTFEEAEILNELRQDAFEAA